MQPVVDKIGLELTVVATSQCMSQCVRTLEFWVDVRKAISSVLFWKLQWQGPLKFSILKIYSVGTQSRSSKRSSYMGNVHRMCVIPGGHSPVTATAVPRQHLESCLCERHFCSWFLYWRSGPGNCPLEYLHPFDPQMEAVAVMSVKTKRYGCNMDRNLGF